MRCGELRLRQPGGAGKLSHYFYFIANVNPPVEPNAPQYVTCYCLHCKGGIEFDAHQLRPNEKRAVTCPHCKAETILIIPERKTAPAVPADEISAAKLEAAKLEAARLQKSQIVKPEIAQPDDWRVELPLGGRHGYIGYFEGARTASFFWEFGGGVVVAIIHIGSPADWNRLYPWAADRRPEILQRVIREVIRQRALNCKADIDEKNGHIFFREAEAVPPVLEPAAKPPELSKPQSQPESGTDAKWQQEMGVAYFRQKDFGAAVKCFTSAAELGEAEAQCYLGFCFLYGQGVEKDEAKALAWFLKAAAQKHVGAEYCLGGAFYLGRGVPQDIATAVKWWRRAGEHGNADAQFSLAGCFEKGEGVMQNLVEAYKWAKRAAAQGHPAAQKKGEELLLKMNPDQIKTVKVLG